MFLREKLQRPLRYAIRRHLDQGGEEGPGGLRVFLWHAGKIARLAAQVETLAAKHGQSGRLDLLNVGNEGDDETPGFLEIVAFIMEHWVEILQLAAIIVPLLTRDGDDPAP